MSLNSMKDKTCISYRPFSFTKDWQEVINLRLKPNDIVELIGHGHWSIPMAINNCLELSNEVYVICVCDGECERIVGVFGLTVLSDEEACPWLLSTDELKEHSMDFLRGSRHVLAKWMTEWSTLRNRIWDGNLVGIKWLKWLGFTIHKDSAYTLDGSIYYVYFSKANN